MTDGGTGATGGVLGDEEELGTDDSGVRGREREEEEDEEKGAERGG